MNAYARPIHLLSILLTSTALPRAAEQTPAPCPVPGPGGPPIAARLCVDTITVTQLTDFLAGASQRRDASGPFVKPEEGARLYAFNKE